MSAIIVQDLAKRFSYAALPRDTTLKEVVVRRLLGRKSDRKVTEALRGISFTVGRGQMLGIVGRNGSGKTTLLRTLAGVYAPDEGRIAIDGAVAPLLSLAAGFHPDLTGRENVRIELMILGFTPKQIEERMDRIVEFAEIGDYIDAPLRTYSAGMMMRLAFAAAISVDPDVLLLDEVLAVGDEAFALKCLSCIDDFRARGKTIVLVTHNSQVVRDRCDIALWLHSGEIAAYGNPIEVTDAYHGIAAAALQSLSFT